MKKNLLATMLALGVAMPAMAATPTYVNVFDLRVNNSANSGNRATGDIIVWGANGVAAPADNPDAYVYGFAAICPIGKTCGSVATDPNWLKQGLLERDLTVYPHQYFGSRPYDTALTGSWRLYLSTNAGFTSSTIVQTPSLGNVKAMPFVSSMSVSGSGLTPTISWKLPDSPAETIDAVRVRVFDNSHPVTLESRAGSSFSTLQADNIFMSSALHGSTYALPTGVLSYGTNYSIAIDLDHLRPDGSPISRSTSYFDFTPIDPTTLPSGVTDIALPTVVPVPTTSGLLAGPVYSFHVSDVSPDKITFIDPVVATGFTYKTGAGDPNFKSVQVATNVGDGLYEVWSWNGGAWQQVESHLAAGASFDFTAHGFAAGVDRFEIRGIESSAGVNAFDLTAFVTGLTFVGNGDFTGTMQAITVDVVPEPATYALWLAGAGVLVAWRRRRT